MNYWLVKDSELFKVRAESSGHQWYKGCVHSWMPTKEEMDEDVGLCSLSQQLLWAVKVYLERLRRDFSLPLINAIAVDWL
jgi:hypothetical protein